jgi:hypothetical protein
MTTATTPARQPAKPRQGKSLLIRLHEAGIQADNVTQNQRTGLYAVKFVAPNLNSLYSKTDSAQVWSQRILEAIPDAEIVELYDSRAEWRPQLPILFATVFLALPAQKKSAIA